MSQVNTFSSAKGSWRRSSHDLKFKL